ncbi:MAG: type II toxin-antitoxin system mRNA interferase toxin, RelE/StbE family [Nanoarchaeota archaeon]|nr:type II toxin-antitoxin system mRNA interferase toxin, RelE/StbE family [Nanoarchaeota archaeon]MBU1004644.1 type II toxin-antitoxin system mRNA interferase toxin, RelE/StbE family [Nanoarchaeota archaeon]MBU1946198.1 type II toxin-antitoxin system mRNA interferase toxin, RelE/StbE family [Nanoarchaeota archaeon]
MAYALDISEHLDKIFFKLSKKDKKQLEIINKKVNEILENPHRYKPLKGDMHGAFRVHIDKSFVLMFEIDEKDKVVRLLDYDHHDNIY